MKCFQIKNLSFIETNQFTSFVNNQLKFENKKNQIKVIAFKLKIIPKNIYANFLPINAVSGSSFTLIKSFNNIDKFSINIYSNLRFTEKLDKLVVISFSIF